MQRGSGRTSKGGGRRGRDGVIAGNRGRGTRGELGSAGPYGGWRLGDQARDQPAARCLCGRRSPRSGRNQRRGRLRSLYSPSPPHQGRDPNVTASLQGFSPTSHFHHPCRDPHLPQNQQVRPYVGFCREPGGSGAAHASPQHWAALAAVRRLRHILASQPLPGHRAATSGSHCGVTLRSHGALFSPPPSPRRDKIITQQGPRESPGKGKLTEGNRALVARRPVRSCQAPDPLRTAAQLETRPKSHAVRRLLPEVSHRLNSILCVSISKLAV